MVILVSATLAAALNSYSARASDENGAVPALEEVTVSARRQSESALKVPESITFFDSAAIQNLDIKSFDDYATKIPNLSFSYGTSTLGFAGSQAVAIRGISGAGTTGMYIDDTPIPDSIDTQVVDIQRIEVLKGPQGTLYGAGSMGGNVRIITQRPEFKNDGNYTVSAGYTDRGSTPDGRLNAVGNFVAIDDRVAVRTVTFADHEAGFFTREFPSAPNSTQFKSEGGQGATTSYGGSVSALVKFSDNASATLRFLGQGTDGHGAAVAFAPLPVFDPAGYVLNRQSDIQERWYDRWYLPSVEIHLDAGAWSFTSSSSYFRRHLNNVEDSTEGTLQILQGFYGVPTTSAVGASGVPWVNGSTDERFNQEVRASWTGSGPLKASLGARYAHEHQVAEFPPLVSSALITEGLWPNDLLFAGTINTTNRDTSIFGEIYYTFSAFELTLGARKFWLQQYSSIFQDGFINGGALSNPSLDSAQSGGVPKVALSYTAQDGTLVYASASKGFRSGGPNQVLPPVCDIGVAQLGLTPGQLLQFKSDSLWNYEVGAKGRVGGLTLSGAAFQMNWSEIQQRIILPVCFLPETVNAGKARIRGVELEASGKLTGGLEFRLGLGYQDPKILDPGLSGLPAGSRILQVPYYTGTAALSYTRPLTDSVSLYVSSDYSYVGSSLSNTTTSQFGALEERAGYGLWNARLGGEWSANRLELYAKNILKKEANIGDIYPAGYPQTDPNGNPLPRVAVLPPLQLGIQFSHRF
jgi:outer membrane receptor protein involved in Fe transport